MRSILAPAVMAVLLLVAASPSAQAQVPVGAEFRVNTYTTGGQNRPAVGMSADGSFVIAWESPNIDGSLNAAMGQRYAAPGTAQGANFQVNTYTTSLQGDVAVAVARDGSFVVVWESNFLDGSNDGIFGQRYDASGNRLGGEFQVNTYTTNSQYSPSVAIAHNKSFVVIWASLSHMPGGISDTFAQRFDAAGNRQGGEFQVNTYTSGYQYPGPAGPGVAIDASLNFVVVWSSSRYPAGPDGSAGGVFAQRFSSSGIRLGGEFQINTYTTGYQEHPTVAAALNGNFVVVWNSPQDGSDDGIFGQRFDASGSRLGGEFRVNTYTTSFQAAPTVASDALGNFVVVWDSAFQDGSFDAVMARRFAANGNARGAEFRVNTYTTDSQARPSIASDAVGNFVVVWESNDGSSTGVFAQRFVSDLIFRSGFDPTNP